MTKVKLLSNLQIDSATYSEGEVVDLPAERVEQLVKIGAAELTDAAPTADSPPPEVEPAAAPLAPTQAAGEQTPTETQANPASVEQSTPQPPASSTANLHLG